MSTVLKRHMARQLYEAGHALYQEGRYEQALVELRRAEDAFRKIDARGHPFTNPLPNKVSGLANCLALEGMCYQDLGDLTKAIRCFETSLINAAFERKGPFRSFVKTVNEHLAACYEKKLEQMDAGDVDSLIEQDQGLDTSYRFPFSLNPDVIPLARLYELAPQRYQRFKDFYERSRKKYADIIKRNKFSDESIMRKFVVSVWSVLFIVWAVYGIVALNTLINR